MGAEARGKGVSVLLAPMMNMARAYESGRTFEGYGEDPCLSGAMAAAEIRGIQGQDVIATAKHFVCYEEETDRTLISSDVDERTQQEIYYLPFLQSVRAGAGAVMASYNRLNSRHACETEALNTALKKLWGFNGFVMSDWGATFSTVAGMNNGMDMDMYCGYYLASTITNEIQWGSVPSSELDGMVQRILTTMFQFGIFDNPPTGNLSSVVTNAAHNLFARQAAAEGVVLLQNNRGLLPVGASVHSIAVIGSVASVAPISTGAGSAGVVLPYNVTPLAGITSRAGSGITVNYAQGDGVGVSQAAAISRHFRSGHCLRWPANQRRKRPIQSFIAEWPGCAGERRCRCQFKHDCGGLFVFVRVDAMVQPSRLDLNGVVSRPGKWQRLGCGSVWRRKPIGKTPRDHPGRFQPGANQYGRSIPRSPRPRFLLGRFADRLPLV